MGRAAKSKIPLHQIKEAERPRIAVYHSQQEKHSSNHAFNRA